MSAATFPIHGGDPRIGGEGVARKFYCLSRKLAQSLNARGAQTDPPGLANNRRGLGECPAHQDRQIATLGRIADRQVADHIRIRRSGSVGEDLTAGVIDKIGPDGGVGRQRFARQIQETVSALGRNPKQQFLRSAPRARFRFRKAKNGMRATNKITATNAPGGTGYRRRLHILIGLDS